MRGTPGGVLDEESFGFQLAAPEGDLLARARAAADRLVGPYAVVRRCRPYPPVPGLPSTPIFVARGPLRDFGGRHAGFDVIGMGVSDDAADARLKAIIETVERYCFAWPHDPSLVERHSYEEVAGHAVAPEHFRPFTEAQYRARPSLRFPGPSDPVDWAWAYSLTRQRFALIPAPCAFSTVGLRPPNNFLASTSSTGVACHVSVEAALLAGLLEVVERDAIMLYWLNRRRPRRIALEGPGAAEVVQLLDDHFRVCDFEFVLLDITADSGIPTVCCLARSADPGRPRAAFGAACRPDPAAAARKALFESAQVLSGLHGLGFDARSSLALSDVRNIWDHARYYAVASNSAPLDAFAGSGEEIDIGDIQGFASGVVADDLGACVERLAAVGLEVLCVELTPPDVARSGLRTMKVIVPGMVDINGDARLPHLGPERVHRVPGAMGWPALADDGHDLAPCPLS